ncbi:MAG: 6-carboxytetrahydropterin synthase [Myxococcales bacterium]|nr:6-carboxytetrahydropterin synthase [Myxococcales bacterium]
MIELTRCYRFPASHVLARDDFSPDQNLRTYGKCANPAGHGHDYGVEVTVRGPVDDATGEVMSRSALDDLVAERVLQRFAHRHLNDDALFAERVPTAENIAAAVHERLEGAVAAAGSARLVRVRVHETRKNSFTHGEME